ncbi:MAG TPA: bifunctional phosphopantothenoylcysteine decarboxylase/phosphopantothenate--cysteine ligase CoaBC [Firmicutes bacterium]|jgi:phosphopantothenoylcysteine decarboxylase/phosphopantothenate--cysteine ligase|nr:bifunctional phosphopantothenoylcysteine decarboxylase/phosphopantothenate--cysteine ligase CoaBC [Bacillota bacterium]
MLQGRAVLLGISGGIAAYKSAELARLLIREGCSVQVIMTRSAKKFISPLTMHGLTGRPVYSSLFHDHYRAATAHIELAREPDLAIVAPATANILGKTAMGIADDLLSTVLMAIDLEKCPVILAPSMNVTMLENPAVRGNIHTLEARGFLVADPGRGDLACGEVGKGRMAEPLELLGLIKKRLLGGRDYEGVTVLISAGPTREALDPVRFLTNHSSGKMGYALAGAARDRGANVILVSGPTALEPPWGVRFLPVVTAEEMYKVIMDNLPGTDIIIKAAAVADYRPVEPSGQKIKKAGEMQLKLVRNPDILREISTRKTVQFLVGFAAETENLQENARRKMEEKKLDMIVANDLGQEGAGFNVDTNIVRLLYKDGSVEKIPLMSKIQLSHLILDRIRKHRGTETEK